MKNDIKSILLNREELNDKIQELGKIISKDYKGKNPIIIAILRGAAVFASDLIRAISIPIEIDFMSLSSYGNSTKSSGVVKIRKDVDTDLTGKDVIIVEDIIDSGLTMNYLKKYLADHNPNSVKLCTLLDKPKAHKVEMTIDYKGFDIGNEFVVGYGLDFAEKYRNLPYIGILKEEVYNDQ